VSVEKYDKRNGEWGKKGDGASMNRSTGDSAGRGKRGRKEIDRAIDQQDGTIIIALSRIDMIRLEQLASNVES